MLSKTNSDLQAAGADEFTAEELSAVDAIIERYRSKPGSLIPVLEDVQEALGYLPKSIQRKISLGLGVPLSEVYGVVTFYSFFTMAPRGRHTVKCCLGTACYVKEGKWINFIFTLPISEQKNAKRGIHDDKPMGRPLY